MQKKYPPIFYLFLVLWIESLPFASIAQSKFPSEAGLLLGISNYAGDIVKKGNFDPKTFSPSFGVFYRWYYNMNLSARFGVNQTTIKGNDYNWTGTDRIGRGFNFTSPLTEITTRIEYDMFNHKRRRGGNIFTNTVSPFFYIGVGVGLINPKNDFNLSKNSGLLAQINEDKNNRLTNVVTIPFGGGIRYDINEQFLIGIELGLNPVFTDYLDGISMSAEPANDDWYALGGLSVTYRLNSIFAKNLFR